MAHFVGTWKLTKSDNFDAVLQKLGVNVIKRKLINSTHPEVTYTLDGENMTIKTVSALKTTTIHFQFGKEFEEKTADDRTVMSTVTKESDDKLVQIQKHPDNTTEIVREVHGDSLTSHVSVGDVKAVLQYTKK
ncbi:unnamed protein product [Calicophoron daubneyi]|uniref:Cytosolic fatty-acid binding proteins domain-containing protein n=1 Tax=Calicophoron daubneyi TaxID=300641 RepID=A0AAV2TG44_CALDB